MRLRTNFLPVIPSEDSVSESSGRESTREMPAGHRDEYLLAFEPRGEAEGADARIIALLEAGSSRHPRVNRTRSRGQAWG